MFVLYVGEPQNYYYYFLFLPLIFTRHMATQDRPTVMSFGILETFAYK